MLRRVIVTGLLGLTAGRAAAAEEPVVRRSDTAYVTVSIGDLALPLPRQLSGIVERPSDATAGTGSFQIEYQAIDPATGEAVLRRVEADVQAHVAPCAAVERRRVLERNFGGREESRQSLSVTDVSGAFNGFVFAAEDHRRDDRNFLFGFADRDRGLCYSTSLAVYGVRAMPPPQARRIVRFLTDRIGAAFDAFKNPGGQL